MDLDLFFTHSTFVFLVFLKNIPNSSFHNSSQTSGANVTVFSQIRSERAQPLVEPAEVSPSEQKRMEWNAGWDISALHKRVNSCLTPFSSIFSFV